MVQHKETAEQARLFEIYYSMGSDRSLAKLHEQLPQLAPDFPKAPSLKTLKNWSSWFNWQQRITIKDRAVADGLDKKTTKDAINLKARYLHYADALVEDAFDTGPDGNIKLRFQIEKVKDLKDVIELALKLMGEPETRSEHNLFFEWVENNSE